MDIQKLRVLRKWEEIDPIEREWWQSYDSFIYGFTAGHHAENLWRMEYMPTFKNHSRIRDVHDWAQQVLNLTKEEALFLFVRYSHNTGETWKDITNCSQEEATARLDYLIANGKTPPRDEGRYPPHWTHWGKQFKKENLTTNGGISRWISVGIWIIAGWFLLKVLWAYIARL